MNSKKIKIGVFIIVAALIAGALVALIVNKSTGPNIEKHKGINRDHGIFGSEITVYDATDGEVVILNKLSTNDGKDNTDKKNSEEVKTTTNPDTVLDGIVQAGTFTPVEKARMKDGSIGILTIPEINLSVNVFESETTDTIEAMNNGVAHFPNTSVWDGNIAVSAHNINFDGSAGYFLNLHTLKKGDTISYATALGERHYTVISVKSISDSDWSPLGYTEENHLTLITCITGHSQNRLCVQAVEISKQ